MAAAIIGLVGVAVGALLTALTTAWQERLRDTRASATAERTLRAALDEALRQLDVALQMKSWWPAALSLPFKTLTDNEPRLSSDLPDEDHRKLDIAFEAMENLDKLADSRRRKPDETPALTDAEDEDVRKRKGNIVDAIAVLDGRKSARHKSKSHSKIYLIMATAIIAAAALVVAGLFSYQKITAPPSVTGSSLSSSIEDTTHVDFASCEQTGASTADWQCMLADLGGSGCSSGLLSAPISQVARINLARALATPSCDVTGEDAVEVEVNSAACWILAKNATLPPPSGDPPDVLPSPTASGCI